MPLEQLAGAEKLGWTLFRPHEQFARVTPTVHRFRSVDQNGFFGLAKDLARLTADSIDTAALELLVAGAVGAENARKMLGPLFGVYELRHTGAHLPSKDLNDALRLVGVNTSSPFVAQGLQLLDSCVVSLQEIAQGDGHWTSSFVTPGPPVASLPNVAIA